MASTAILTKSPSAFFSRHYHPAAIKATMRTGTMGEKALTALGTGAPLGSGHGVMSPALVLFALGSPSFRYRHF